MACVSLVWIFKSIILRNRGGGGGYMKALTVMWCTSPPRPLGGGVASQTVQAPWT